MSAALNELGAFIELKRADCVLAWDVTHGELNVDVAPSNIVDFIEDCNVRWINASIGLIGAVGRGRDNGEHHISIDIHTNHFCNCDQLEFSG